MEKGLDIMASASDSTSDRKRVGHTVERLEPGLSRLLLSCALVLISGFIDAVGYLQLGKIYLSFMSGNSTKLGIALFEGDSAVLTNIGLVIFLFVVGAFIGTLITDRLGKWRLAGILGFESLLFAGAIVFLLFLHTQSVLFPIAVAMGMQNTMHQMVAHADVGKGFVTGTLFGIGQALAKAVRGKAPASEWAVLALSWVIFVFGAALGALLLTQGSLLLALIASLALLLLLIPYVLHVHRDLT